MKLLLSAISIVAIFIATAAQAQTTSISCSNSTENMNIQISVYNTSVKANHSFNSSKVTIKTVTFAGPQVIELETQDLNISEVNREGIDWTVKTSLTICDIPQKTTTDQYVATISFSKKDGSAIIINDTPNRTIKTIPRSFICTESTTDAWPCK